MAYSLPYNDLAMGSPMSMPRDGLSYIDEMLGSVADLITDSVLEVVRSSIDGDPVVSVTVSRRCQARTLGMRVNVELILVSIESSQALEFAWKNPDEMATLASLFRSFCKGGFEVQMGSKDGQYYGVRGPGFDLEMGRYMWGFLRSGKLEWRRIDYAQNEPHS